MRWPQHAPQPMAHSASSSSSSVPASAMSLATGKSTARASALASGDLPPPGAAAPSAGALSGAAAVGTAGAGPGGHVGNDALSGHGAASSELPRGTGLQERFTPPDLDMSRCLARLVREGVASQCRNRPVKGHQVCQQHKPFRGKRKARYGLVVEALPEDVVPQLSALYQAEQARTLDCGRSSSECMSGHAGSSLPGASERTVRATAPENMVGDGIRRSRIVTGFGAERVEDVAADEARRLQEGAQRGSHRRDTGERGRATDLYGNALDRSAGGAWHAGRR